MEPVDSTTLLANGLNNAISGVAIAERRALTNASGVFYMEKIAVGVWARGAIDLSASITDNLRSIARIKLIPHGDVAGVLLNWREVMQ